MSDKVLPRRTRSKAQTPAKSSKLSKEQTGPKTAPARLRKPPTRIQTPKTASKTRSRPASKGKTRASEKEGKVVAFDEGGVDCEIGDEDEDKNEDYENENEEENEDGEGSDKADEDEDESGEDEDQANDEDDGDDDESDEEEDERIAQLVNMAASTYNSNAKDDNASEFKRSANSLLTSKLYTKQSDGNEEALLVRDSVQLHYEDDGKQTKRGKQAKAVIMRIETAETEEVEALMRKTAAAEDKLARENDRTSRGKSAGSKWFNMQGHELTKENERDLQLIKMRSVLDPKRFYKAYDHKGKRALPKVFQVGTMIEGAHEFKSGRLTKKQRKETFADELMADSSFKHYAKQKFLDVQTTKGSGGKKWYKGKKNRATATWKRR
jgi:hypothetical protein